MLGAVMVVLIRPVLSHGGTPVMKISTVLAHAVTASSVIAITRKSGHGTYTRNRNHGSDGEKFDSVGNSTHKSSVLVGS